MNSLAGQHEVSPPDIKRAGFPFPSEDRIDNNGSGVEEHGDVKEHKHPESGIRSSFPEDLNIRNKK